MAVPYIRVRRDPLTLTDPTLYLECHPGRNDGRPWCMTGFCQEKSLRQWGREVTIEEARRVVPAIERMLEERGWLPEIVLQTPSGKGFQASPIPVSDQTNFETLRSACSVSHLALVSAIRKVDGQRVSLVCAMNFCAEDRSVRPMPLAVMIEGDPFELFEDPTSDADPTDTGRRLDVS